MVMLNVSIGGSREGNTGGITGKEQPLFSAYMHAIYCYHCEGPHTLYYNDRHGLFPVLIAEYGKKCPPPIKRPDIAYDF